MPGDVLRFVYSARPPTSDVRVFDSLTRQFLGTEFTFRVVGSSHYVSAPAYDFYELSSCEPVACGDVATVRLDGGLARSEAGSEHGGEADTSSVPDCRDRAGVQADSPPARRIEYETDAVRCETVIERQPLAVFPENTAFDLTYWFDDRAVTAIDIGTEQYETYHTYPEFDLALYTRTAFERVTPAPPAGKQTDDCTTEGATPPTSTD